MPKGPRKFQFSFEKTGLTRFGGLSLFQSFCKSLGLSSLPAALRSLARLPSPELSSCRSFSSSPVFDGGWNWPHRERSVADPQRSDSRASGSARVSSPRHFEELSLALWPQGAAQCGNRSRRLRQELFRRLGLLHSAIIDADTTALLTYGHQEGVAVGFVPKKRHGQPSYAPILSSEGRCGLTLGMELRAGNVHPATGALSFLNQMLDKLPSSIATTRTRLRSDGAFYDRKIIEAIDQERIGYVVSAKMTRPLRNTTITARYQPFGHGWEAAGFTYMPFRWQREHRFVAVRRAAALEPESIQQRLFTFKQYTYHQALVTNLEPTPALAQKLGVGILAIV
jgi:Transposase DDE domain group 1